MLGTEGEQKSPLKAKGRSSTITQTLRPTCSWSPARAKDHLFWGLVEDELSQEDTVTKVSDATPRTGLGLLLREGQTAESYHPTHHQSWKIHRDWATEAGKAVYSSVT